MASIYQRDQLTQLKTAKDTLTKQIRINGYLVIINIILTIFLILSQVAK